MLVCDILIKLIHASDIICKITFSKIGMQKTKTHKTVMRVANVVFSEYTSNQPITRLIRITIIQSYFSG